MSNESKVREKCKTKDLLWDPEGRTVSILVSDTSV